MKGRPLDPDQQAQEAEAAELNAELALTGAGIYRVSNYLSIREPAGDAEALVEVLDAIGRELSGANEAHLHPAVAAQREVLSSSLPTGCDTAGRTRKYVSVNVVTRPLWWAPAADRPADPARLLLGRAHVGAS